MVSTPILTRSRAGLLRKVGGIPPVEVLVAHATSFSKEARWLRVPTAARLVHLIREVGTVCRDRKGSASFALDMCLSVTMTYLKNAWLNLRRVAGLSSLTMLALLLPQKLIGVGRLRLR